MSAPREFDDRQEALHRIDTHRTQPMTIEPSRRPKPSRWQRFLNWLHQALGR